MSGDKIYIDRDMLRNMLKMLKELSELMEKYYDELDLYILTLEIMLEENEEERKVVATARNIEELKKALEYDEASLLTNLLTKCHRVTHRRFYTHGS